MHDFVAILCISIVLLGLFAFVVVCRTMRNMHTESEDEDYTTALKQMSDRDVFDAAAASTKLV